MTQIIQIDPRQLKAIALLAPKTDQRYWLNGVFVEASSTETRLVAMDGKRMGVFLAAKANQLAGAIQASAILPHDALDFVRPSRGRFAQLELRIDPAVPRWAELTHGAPRSSSSRLTAGIRYTVAPWDHIVAVERLGSTTLAICTTSIASWRRWKESCLLTGMVSTYTTTATTTRASASIAARILLALYDHRL